MKPNDMWQCDLSRAFGIAHLCGKQCPGARNIYHVMYRASGTKDRLISACQRCHELLMNEKLIHGLRFVRRPDHQYDLVIAGLTCGYERT